MHHFRPFHGDGRAEYYYTWNSVSDVYSLCVAYPEPLADRLYEETKSFLEGHVNKLLQQVKDGHTAGAATAGGGSNLLKAYHDAWKEFSRGITYLHMLYS